MKISIGCDHRGYKLKETIKEHLSNHTVKDVGCFNKGSVDYPEIGRSVAADVSSGSSELGIAICGSGIGMSIVANRLRNVRAALCRDEQDAEISRKHNNSNVLVLGADRSTEGKALSIVDTWLSTDFEGGHHERRIKKIDESIGESL